MRKSLVVLMFLGAMSAPAWGQTTHQHGQVQASKPQTVKKVVCERVDVEETTGSRLGSAPKRCKTVEVPVKGKSSTSNPQQAPHANQAGSE
jgi:hypothetical protein